MKYLKISWLQRFSIKRISICTFASLKGDLQMHKDKYVFSQLVPFLDRNKFNYIVCKYDGDKYVKHFTCWNQLLALMFGQLSLVSQF